MNPETPFLQWKFVLSLKFEPNCKRNQLSDWNFKKENFMHMANIFFLQPTEAVLRNNSPSSPIILYFTSPQQFKTPLHMLFFPSAIEPFTRDAIFSPEYSEPITEHLNIYEIGTWPQILFFFSIIPDSKLYLSPTPFSLLPPLISQSLEFLSSSLLSSRPLVQGISPTAV
jgi:hypothetical protein